jgi:hypothetical protein
MSKVGSGRCFPVELHASGVTPDESLDRSSTDSCMDRYTAFTRPGNVGADGVSSSLGIH